MEAKKGPSAALDPAIAGAGCTTDGDASVAAVAAGVDTDVGRVIAAADLDLYIIAKCLPSARACRRIQSHPGVVVVGPVMVTY